MPVAYFSIPLNEDFELKIGAHLYTVRFVDSTDYRLGEDNHGKIIFDEYSIFIRKTDPDSIKLSTLLHELIHVFEQLYDIKISHKDLNLVGELFAQILLTNFSTKTREITNGRKTKRNARAT